jgi:hypothetical protein
MTTSSVPLTDQQYELNMPPLHHFGWFLILLLCILMIIYNLTTPTPAPQQIPFPKQNGSVTIPHGDGENRIKMAWYTYKAIGNQCSLDIFSETLDRRFTWANWKSNRASTGTSLGGECTFEKISTALDDLVKFIFGDTPESQAIINGLKKQLAERFLPN